MAIKKFHKYLINLGFSEKEVSKFSHENIFSYSPSSDSPIIRYIRVKNQEDIFNQHLRLWNRNNDNVFIAVDDSKTYIVDCKKKPRVKKTAYIQTFDYGVNSLGYEDISIELISKSHIDSSIFYQFIQKNQRKKQEVDKDLLLNLIALRNDLISDNNNKVIHLLILRCLFVKYLEDRGIFETNFLSNILKSNSSERLINAFSEVCKINGDVFGGNRLFEGEIKVDYLEKLYLFFTTDYQSGQGTLFPYQFNNIPIQLISHVYEAFLNNNIKKGKGIYYTPSFVVDFMLSQSLKKKVEENPYLTVLDPAVGSGAFLVESFKIIRDILSKKLKRKLHYNEKKQILEKQLWGIDTDNDALQITAFSLYLALLEDESPEFIKTEIENSHPILPSMIGTVLVNGNTIVDSIFEEKKFDFIVSNPPWGSIPADGDKENITEREAIDNKKGVYLEYNSVADYERSQAFLMRIGQWQKQDTVIAMIVKNSIFLNDKAVDFREEFLEKNQIQTFYELSNYNRILFRKKVIGKIRGKEPVEIGASEPCVILIFKPNKNKNDYKINYIAPKLTKFGEHFEVIQYTENESFYINKSAFLKDDILWRILVNSDYEGFQLIKNRISPQNELVIEVRAGFQPKQNMEQLGTPIMKSIIEPQDFEAYFQKNTELKKFNWNQKLHRRRDESIYSSSRILLPVRPLKGDKRKLRGVHVDEEIVFKHNILALKIKQDENYISDNLPYLGIINSKLIGFYIYNISSQWGKGEEKRASLRNVDLETLPIRKIKGKENSTQISNYIKNYIRTKTSDDSEEILLNKLDEVIFNLYGLTEYEREIIKEFYQVNVERSNEKMKYAQTRDILEYFQTFKKTFNLILSPNHSLNASYYISKNIGAIIKISIVNSEDEEEIIEDNTLQVLSFVKNKQLIESDKLLKEEKIKLYEPTHFYLVKSNQFKDWTKRQAYKDAKEEVGLLVSKMPKVNE